MTTLEITNEGETIKIETGNTTTASDVIDILNGKWPGCAKLIEITRLVQYDPIKEIENQKRKQKSIDRIAWKAERQKRYQKGGHFK